MGQNAVTGAMLQCTFGVAPATLSVLPTAKVTIEGKPAAAIMDNIAMVNIPPFGMCTSLSNPQVAAATAALPKRSNFSSTSAGMTVFEASCTSCP